ncbi:MAG TPA: NACHT domain-containing protein [Thermoanaerobaculia bacterium]|nr:NACHT domain-containing protein [Thermoanaerobaculia bacterium]
MTAAIQARARADERENHTARGVQELKLLFESEALVAGLSLQDVLATYSSSFEAAKRSEPIYRRIEPSAGWLVAGVLLLMLLLRDFIKETILASLKALRERIYRAIAGHPLVRIFALRHYRKALFDRFNQFRVPFRPDRPLRLEEIYVSVRAKEGKLQASIDAMRLLADRKRLVVTGAPGSGKSIWLKYIALRFATGRLHEVSPDVTVALLELSRLNDGDSSIEQHLVEIFKINDFPNAETFVESSLRRGTLMLLFDGLDEVNSTKRTQVVNKIKAFLDQHQGCRAIITCRTAVYRNDFVEIADVTAEIEEFSDQQVQSYLVAWERYPPRSKSILQLVLTLRERPRIMALARNPLLLTIIAFLYSDSDFVLPHSRTEFYDQSIDVLLRQWRPEINLHKPAHKRLVLEHLALFNQRTGVAADLDRRSIDLQTTLEQISEVLPSLNLEPKDAQPLLEEIVERSGLLLSIDGGAKFQFAHLTLQEFFAAKALQGDAQELLRRFSADEDAWREPLKLWCGLDLDSTAVVKEIYATHPVVALECLADAQKIDAVLADRILEAFKTQLSGEEETPVSTLGALAAIASGPTARGEGVYTFLAMRLQSDTPRARRAAATALSLTNKPAAATLLGAHYLECPEDLRQALVRMGDLAVTSLVTIAESRPIQAMEDLQNIGTAEAVRGMVALLRMPEEVAAEAAWGIGSLLTDHPELELVLRTCIFPEELSVPAWSWVWRPFPETSESPLPHIASRAAYLMERSLAWKEALPTRVESRFIIPLIIYEAAHNPPPSLELSKHLSRITEPDDEEEKAALNALRAAGATRLVSLLGCISPKRRSRLFALAIRKWPSVRDWINLSRRTFNWHGSFEQRLSLGTLVLASTASVVLGLVHILFTRPPMALCGVYLGAFGILVFNWFTLADRESELNPGRISIVFVGGVLGVLALLATGTRTSSWRESFQVAGAVFFSPALLTLSLKSLFKIAGFGGAIGIWVGVGIVVGSFELLGWYKGKRSQSYLRGIVGDED